MIDFPVALFISTSFLSATARVVRALFALRPPVHLLYAIMMLACARASGAEGAELDPAPPSEPQASAVDNTDVTSSGAFTFSRPISIPTARGPAPRLAISYNSTSGNGIAGYGWQLTGLPAIVRIRGDNGMNFASADTYAYLPGGWGTTASAEDILVSSGFENNWYLTRNAANPIPQFRASTTQAQDGPLYWTMRDGKGTDLLLRRRRGGEQSRWQYRRKC